MFQLLWPWPYQLSETPKQTSLRLLFVWYPSPFLLSSPNVNDVVLSRSTPHTHTQTHLTNKLLKFLNEILIYIWCVYPEQTVSGPLNYDIIVIADVLEVPSLIISCLHHMIYRLCHAIGPLPICHPVSN